MIFTPPDTEKFPGFAVQLRFSVVVEAQVVENFDRFWKSNSQGEG